jgi:hypothetical protein
MADQPNASHAEARQDPSAAILINAQRMSGGKMYE